MFGKRDEINMFSALASKSSSHTRIWISKLYRMRCWKTCTNWKHHVWREIEFDLLIWPKSRYHTSKCHNLDTCIRSKPKPSFIVMNLQNYPKLFFKFKRIFCRAVRWTREYAESYWSMFEKRTTSGHITSVCERSTNKIFDNTRVSLFR